MATSNHILRKINQLKSTNTPMSVSRKNLGNKMGSASDTKSVETQDVPPYRQQKQTAVSIEQRSYINHIMSYHVKYSSMHWPSTSWKIGWFQQANIHSAQPQNKAQVHHKCWLCEYSRTHPCRAEKGNTIRYFTSIYLIACHP